MKKENIELKESLKFYNTRISELEVLKSQTQSKTIQSLIDEAIELTKSTLIKLTSLQSETILYLEKEKTKFHQSKIKIDEQIDLLEKEIYKIENSKEIPESMKTDVLLALNNALNQGKTLKVKKDFVIDIQLNTYPEVSSSFSNVLLNLVYKPNASSFQYDTIIDGLKLLAGFLIPIFDNLNTISSNPISLTVRKKQYLQTGDKVLIYLEKYLDVLKQWDAFADQYIFILTK